MILSLVKLLGGPIMGYFGNKQEAKARKQEIVAAEHLVTMNNIQSGKVAAGNMDIQTVKDVGWKDDFLLIVFMLPMIVIFVEPLIIAFNNYENGAMTEAVLNSFVVLQKAPDLYWGAVGLIFVYVFGYKRMLGGVIQAVIKSKLGGGK